MTLYEFFEDYISINLKDYACFGFDFPIAKIFLYILVFNIIATLILSYRSAIRTTLIKKLKSENALSESSAKTLSSLGINNFGTRLFLTFSNKLSSIVLRTEIGAQDAHEKILNKEKINFSTAKFYLNASELEEAERIIRVPTPSIISTILFCVLLVAIYLCVILIIPEFLTFVDSIF